MAKFRNRVKSAVSTDFSKVVSSSKPMSTFNRSSSNTLTMIAGKVVPIYVDEVLPGDNFKLDLAYLARLSTPVFPTMSNLNLDFYAFFAPSRLLWDGWENLIANQNDNGAWVPSEDPAPVPQTALTDWDPTGMDPHSLADYLGIPLTFSRNDSVNALPFRMYYRIWNEYFRDENLQAPIPVSYGDSGVFPGVGHECELNLDRSVLLACKPHDYFTSCLPQPQKGDSPLIPLSIKELLPVITGVDRPTPVVDSSDVFPALRWKSMSDGTLYSPAVHGLGLGVDTMGDTASNANNDSFTNPGEGLAPINLYADPTVLGNLSSTTISELRTAFQIQRILELDARGGTRYIEMLKSHFGVDAGDYRVQRCELLGEFHSTMDIYQVPQTSSTNETSPQGNTAAFGYKDGREFMFNKSFVEHGYLMIVVVARQKKIYSYGLEKFWRRYDRFDFYFPALAHISEQPVRNDEIYYDKDQLDKNSEPFGYQEAWAEYRYKPSRVCGLMRPNASNGLSALTYADAYTSLPTLSDNWIQDNSSLNVDRTLAVSSETSGYQLILDVAFGLKCSRVMPVYSIPGLVDHL